MNQPDPRPYSRVYREIVSDPRFATVFGDDHHLAAWLRLLIAADSAWPASVALPRSASEESVRMLSEAGLIELLAHDHYRVHGLDAERERRSSRARASANVRWGIAEREARADRARRAHMLTLAAKSADARKRKATPVEHVAARENAKAALAIVTPEAAQEARRARDEHPTAVWRTPAPRQRARP